MLHSCAHSVIFIETSQNRLKTAKMPVGGVKQFGIIIKVLAILNFFLHIFTLGTCICIKNAELFFSAQNKNFLFFIGRYP